MTATYAPPARQRLVAWTASAAGAAASSTVGPSSSTTVTLDPEVEVHVVAGVNDPRSRSACVTTW